MGRRRRPEVGKAGDNIDRTPDVGVGLERGMFGGTRDAARCQIAIVAPGFGNARRVSPRPPGQEMDGTKPRNSGNLRGILHVVEKRFMSVVSQKDGAAIMPGVKRVEGLRRIARPRIAVQ